MFEIRVNHTTPVRELVAIREFVTAMIGGRDKKQEPPAQLIGSPVGPVGADGPVSTAEPPTHISGCPSGHRGKEGPPGIPEAAPVNLAGTHANGIPQGVPSQMAAPAHVPTFTPSAHVQQPATPGVEQPAMPLSSHTYTLDELSRAATPLVDAGKIAELRALLSRFGVQAVTQLGQEHYGAFAAALRELGAKL